MLSVQNIAQAHLAQIVAALFVVAALGQLVPRVGAGHVGVEVGGIVGQQPTTDQLLFLPQTEETQLRTIERIFGGSAGLAGLWQNLFEGVPESLRSKAFGRKTPLGSKDGPLV